MKNKKTGSKNIKQKGLQTTQKKKKKHIIYQRLLSTYHSKNVRLLTGEKEKREKRLCESES